MFGFRRKKNTKRILVEAKHLVEQGWTQGNMVNRYLDNPRYCLIGAVLTAQGNKSMSRSDVNPKVAAALSKTVFFTTYTTDVAVDRLINWNDRNSRQQTDVIAVLDKAIASV